MSRTFPGAVSTACLALCTAACATAPEPTSGFLSSYEGLAARSDTVRASVRQRRDEQAARAVEKVHIERTVLTSDAAPALSAEDWSLVLGEMDRQVCYELSERFTVLDAPAPDAARVRLAATRISPTGQAGSAASAVASYFIPGPIGLRAPGTTGGLAAEAELLDPDGRQVAAIVWARNATVVGTDDPSLSRVGDAHQLATWSATPSPRPTASRAPSPIPTPAHASARASGPRASSCAPSRACINPRSAGAGDSKKRRRPTPTAPRRRFRP